MFPAHPAIGECFIGTRNRTWEWDGDKWRKAKKLLPPAIAPSPPAITPLVIDTSFWPSDPIAGEQVTGLDGRTWQFDGEKWVGVAWQPLEIEGPQGPPGEPGPPGPPGLGLLNYAQYEQATGQIWVDGKTVYQKTIKCPPLPASIGHFYLAPHGITGLSWIINAYCVAADLVAGYYLIMPYVDALTLSLSNGLYFDATHVIASSGQDRSSYTEVYVTMVYTRMDS